LDFRFACIALRLIDNNYFAYAEALTNEQEFKRRTKQLAPQTIALVDSLPKTRSADALARQFVRSGTSVGSNYRSACRGKSIDDVIAKLGIVEEEADESIYWLELMAESNMTAEASVKPFNE